MYDYATQHFTDLATVADSDGVHDPEEVVDEVRALLWTHAGILWDEQGLTAGLAKLERIREAAGDPSVGGTTSRSFEFALDLGFALVVSEAILRGALERTESRGAHHRTDYPTIDPNWRRNIVVERDSVGGMRLTSTPVGSPSSAVQEALDANYELDYHQLE